MPSSEPPHELPAGTLSLSEVLERYATLRDTLLGLEAEKDKLGEIIKAALQRGEHFESELYTPRLRLTRRLEYPVARFRETFGDAATLEVATIDRKRAEALAQAGDLDGDKLRAIAQYKEIQALVLTPKS